MNRNFYRDVWLILVTVFFSAQLALGGDISPLFSSALQGRNVSGKVTSGEGEDLPGVNVVIKGENAGTVTDAGGNYSLNVPDGDVVLVFSFIGFTSQEIPVANQTTINVTLVPSMETLSEVVVIGYGTVKKSDLTGSVSSVKAEELRTVPTTSFDQALQGRAAGVQVMQTSGQPGAETSIRIRGVSSITAANEPLYVIDGMLINSNAGDVTAGGGVGAFSPRISPLAAINPGDIESIEILKDASATAMYGSRGTNGVILITTKRGARGTNNIDFETYYSIQEPTKKIDLLDASEFASLVNEAKINAGQVPLYVNPANLGRGTDWQDEVFRQAPMKNYQLSFSGGDEKTQYVVSGGYFDQDGIVINTGFERYSFRTNLQRNISKRFIVGTNLSYSMTRGRSTSTGLQFINPGVVGAALGMNPILPVYDASREGGYTYENDRGTVIGNPVAEALEHTAFSTSARILGNLEARYKILDGLEFKTSFGVDGVTNKDRSFAPHWLKAAQGSRGEAGIATLDAFTWLNENTLTFDKNIGANDNLNAVVGYTLQEFNNERLASFVFDIADPRMGYHNLQAGTNPQPPNNGEMRWSMVSYLGRAQYSMNDKYLFTVTGRVDASSKFSENSKYAFFPSGALGWRVSEEAFMQDVRFISDLKVRASLGIIGNQAISPYHSLALVAPYGEGVFNNGMDYTFYKSSQPSSYASPDLKWETTRQFDVGLDFGLLDNRIQVTADYYKKFTYDLLLSTPIPHTSGFGETVLNVGNIENDGVDIEITSVSTTGAFKWNTSVNFSTNRNTVTKLATEKDVYLAGGLMLREGEPIGTFYGYQFEGIFQSDEEASSSPVFSGQQDTPANALTKARAGDRKYRDVSGDGLINEQDRTIIGNALPDFTWGLNNNLSFMNFNLSFFIQGSHGNEMANLNRLTLDDFRGTQNVSAEAGLNRWTPSNPGNEYPRALANRTIDVGTFSSAIVEDASYVRLKNVTLAYDLPSSVIERARLKKLRVYVSGTNLVTLTDYTGYDPEGSSFGTATSLPGVDQGRYPLSKTYLVGLNIGF